MATQHQLPLRGNDIEIRPVYVEEWLDSLPYIDFNNTTRLLQAALKASNAVPMKATQRMELVMLYNRPYQYYLDTQIKTGAQHNLQSVEKMQSQVTHMKALAVELARASRQALDDALNHKSLWGQNKQPLQAILTSISYLSHVLIFSFLEYAPTPAKIWQEINFLYQYAGNINQELAPIKLPGGKDKSETMTIEQAYKRIALVALADPYHLPFGAVWEIHEQASQWTDMAVLGPFREVKDPNNVFVINLASDKGPLPYIKFNRANASAQHRLLVTENLVATIHHLRQQISNGEKLNGTLLFSDFYAAHLLEIISKAWGMPPKRMFPRKAKSGRLSLAHGINGIFYFLNEEQEFASETTEPGEAVLTDAVSSLAGTSARYHKEPWQLVDTSGGGFSITRDDKPDNTVRVGDLVGMSLDENNYPKETFRVGVIRWLLVRQGKIYKAGIQLINQQLYPASVRAITGSLAENTGRRAILTGRPAKQKEVSLITSKGLYSADRQLEIRYRENTFLCTISRQEESTTCFDHFTVVVDAR